MMHSHSTGVIIKEYFNTISPVLVFRPCEQTNKMTQQVLSLLCTANDCGHLESGCRALLAESDALQSCSDGALLRSSDILQDNIACDIRMDMLSEMRIQKLRSFDASIFVQELQRHANAGERNACKLLAVLYWLGQTVPQNTTTALNIWSMLAMSGDVHALDLLVYGNTLTGRTAEAGRWMHIRSILQAACDAFSAIALPAQHPDCTEEEIQTANLILFISQKQAPKGTSALCRPMLQYVLHSKDDFRTKMNRLSEDTNYFLVMYDENKPAPKKYGF